MATERVTLYGVPIVTDRQVNYARVDPAVARELFLRHALVEGDWETSHEFFARNRRLLDEVEELEHRARRRDILVDDHTLFDFYDRRIPDEVVSARHFDAWWKRARQEQPDLAAYVEPEIAQRIRKPHHAGLIVASKDDHRVRELLDAYVTSWVRFCVAPPA